RMESDSFTLEETYTFTDIEKSVTQNNIDEILSPVARGLQHLDTLYVDERMRQNILYGQKLPMPKIDLQTNPFKVMFQDELFAIYEKHPGNEFEIKPVRVFNIHKK